MGVLRSWNRALRFGLSSFHPLLEGMCTPHPSVGVFAPLWSSTGAGGSRVGVQCGHYCAELVLAHYSEIQTTSNLIPLLKAVLITLSLFSGSARPKPTPVPQLYTVLSRGTLYPSELCQYCRAKMGICFGWCASWGDLRPRLFQSASSTLHLELSKHLCTLHK